MPFADALYGCDWGWWEVYGDKVLRDFAGERWTTDFEAAARFHAHYIPSVVEPGLSRRRGRIHRGLNSGYQALGLAVDFGAAEVILLAYDFKRGPNGEAHHFGDHDRGLPNLGHLHHWVEEMAPMAADLRDAGVRVTNASRDTAITCFQRATIEEALGIKPAPLHVIGMHGLGDNIHQRAVIRRWMERCEVWLETPWPSVYHDLVGPRLHLFSNGSPLRTQRKNAQREHAKFDARKAPARAPTAHVNYPPAMVRQHGAVLTAMGAACRVTGELDFRLPVPDEWKSRAQVWLDQWNPTRPILLYRPLNERKEWGGCAARNPDHEAYAALVESIASRFFVVSVADFAPGKEWAVGRKIRADVELHAGELDFETLAALAARSAMVLTSPGFAAVLAQAVGTPVAVVFGGFEDGKSFSAGARFAPYLAIEPVNPCDCFRHDHACDKRIDLAAATAALATFAASAAAR